MSAVEDYIEAAVSTAAADRSEAAAEGTRAQTFRSEDVIEWGVWIVFAIAAIAVVAVVVRWMRRRRCNRGVYGERKRTQSKG